MAGFGAKPLFAGEYGDRSSGMLVGELRRDGRSVSRKRAEWRRFRGMERFGAACCGAQGTSRWRVLAILSIRNSGWQPWQPKPKPHILPGQHTWQADLDRHEASNDISFKSKHFEGKRNFAIRTRNPRRTVANPIMIFPARTITACPG